MSRLDEIDARLKARLASANAGLRGADTPPPKPAMGLTAGQVLSLVRESSAPQPSAAPSAAQPSAPEGAPSPVSAQLAAEPAPGRRDFAPIDALDDAVGVERLRGFSLKTFFSEVFRRHTDEEAEAVFSCGAGGARVDGWPVPWVFGRALFLSLAVFAGFLFASYHFKNTNLFPGLILVGSFAVPLSTLILFFELNVWRDISFYQVFRCFLCGAIVSLIFSLFLFDSFPGKTLRAAIGMSSAGVVEEVGKLAALLCVVDTAKSRHLLGGMLLGAAVGAGFAAFESAGYALNNLNSGGLDACVHNLMERGVLAPFGHVVWTAIAGAALWRVKGEGRFHPRMLLDARFLRIAWVPMVLHMIWNCDALQLPFELTRILLGIVAWGVALSLAQEGLRGAAAYGRGMRGAPAPAAPRSASSMALAVLAFVVATFSTGFLVSAGGAFFNRVVLPAITGQ